MKLDFPSPEFDAAVAAVCHGAVTDEQARALNDLLLGDGRARDEYLLRVELHARLASDPDLFWSATAEARPGRAAGIAPPDLEEPDAEGRGFPAAPAAGAPGTARAGTFAKRRGPRARNVIARSAATGAAGSPVAARKPGLILVFAACLAFAVIGVWSLWFRQPTSRNGATSTAVAMLTRTVDARWEGQDEPPREGAALPPGSLRLASGLAQIVFYNGARVVIEGPAELRLVSPGEAACLSGRLLAEVPPPARGFRLTADQLGVVDLGTAFAIDTGDGRTEVHVFDGEVRLVQPATAPRSLREGQAASAQAGQPVRLLAADPAAFASLFDFQQRSLASEAFRYEQWQFANARLRQDPALLVHLDFQDFKGADWTLRNGAERNRSVLEATVVGCAHGDGRWREKRALEFQSLNDRARLVVPGELDSLTLAAWVRVSGLDRQFNSLFMCDGFEPGSVHWLIRNDGVLGLTVCGARPGSVEIVASPPVLTLDKLGTWLHLAVVVDGNAGRVVHYLNGAPVSRHGLRLRPPFRIGPAELGNWNARSGPNPAPNLIRNLSGALDEFTLFGRALRDAEIRELYLTGKPGA